MLPTLTPDRAAGHYETRKRFAKRNPAGAEALRVLRQALDNYAERARRSATLDIAQTDHGLQRTFLLEEARARRLRAAVTQLSPSLLAWAMYGALVDVDQVTTSTEEPS